MQLNQQANKRILVVDDFYANPDEVRAFALRQEYQPNPKDHKGQRSKQRFAFPGIKERFEQLLGKRITNWDNYGYNGVFQFCVGGDPIVYHSDRQMWAGVIYLTPDAPPDSGTTIYRSRATKGRTVAESQKTMAYKPASERECEQLMYKDKLLDRTAWETVDVMGNVYNRLALWDARLVHAATNYFGTDINNGRLFQMFFFDVAE
mgnify:CR=1 FL=1